MTRTAESAEAGRSWLDIAEVGTVVGIRALVLVGTVLGRGAVHLVLRAVALYYVLFHGAARRASRDFHRRVGQVPTFGATFRHVLRFAEVAYDNVFFLTGRVGALAIEHTGTHHLREAVAAGRGALLVGAHLGSNVALRAQAGEAKLDLTVVVNFANARRVQGVLDRLDPGAVQILDLGDERDGGGIDAMLRVKEIVDRGGLVALLGDRVPKGGRSVTVEFLGGRARFPVGPFVLAAALRCPVYLTFAIYRAPRHYELRCEPFADAVALPRHSRAEALKEVVQRYAARLQEEVRRAPDNWFNFYDFWEE